MLILRFIICSPIMGIERCNMTLSRFSVNSFSVHACGLCMCRSYIMQMVYTWNHSCDPVWVTRKCEILVTSSHFTVELEAEEEYSANSISAAAQHIVPVGAFEASNALVQYCWCFSLHALAQSQYYSCESWGLVLYCASCSCADIITLMELAWPCSYVQAQNDIQSSFVACSGCKV